MQKTIELHKEKVLYTVKTSKRAKRMRLAVYCDGNCVVTVPRMVPQTMIEKFLLIKSRWLIEKLEYFRSFPTARRANDKEEYLLHKQQALQLVKNRLDYFNQFYNYAWNDITIKNQKTRWGSCSKKGNLNFNYKIALLPKEMADYIIVHELCHLGEFNHSQKFWNLVARACPEYKEVRKSLKNRVI